MSVTVLNIPHNITPLVWTCPSDTDLDPSWKSNNSGVSFIIYGDTKAGSFALYNKLWGEKNEMYLQTYYNLDEAMRASAIEYYRYIKDDE